MILDWKLAEKRLNQIVQVDVMSSKKADFLATHMPFERLGFQETGNQFAQESEMSEEAIYQQYVKNEDNEHRFIIVKGNNGTGKSHLIRWMHARMENDMAASGRDDEKLIFIRRIDNSLKGAMRQLLAQNVVTDSEQRARMEKFVDSTEAQSQEEIMSTIFFRFLTLVETGTDASVYPLPYRKRIYHFLLSDAVKDFLMSESGPIARYYELIVQPKGETNTQEPAFVPEDFTAMKELRTAIIKEGNNDAKMFLQELTTREASAERFCKFLNGYSHDVIRHCANIVQGDAEGMISNLRRQLKEEGRNLTIFIEDLTTFTGIDTELVKVLSIKHGGEYSDLCRVTAIIGITRAYYESSFKGNFQDRVTHQINIDTQAYGSLDALCSMAARYINAMQVPEDEIELWAQNGAQYSELPYHSYEPAYSWDSITIEGKQFTIFPFTRHSLKNLYDRLAEKTPRNFIRNVLKVQLRSFVMSKLGKGAFPATSKTSIGTAIFAFGGAQDESAFEKSTETLSKDDKERLRVALCLWGSATVASYQDDNGKQFLAGLPVEYLSEFSLPIIDGNVVDYPGPTGMVDSESSRERQPKEKVVDPNLEKHLNDLKAWKQQNSGLAYSEDARKYVYDFIREAISWQSEGVPYYWLTVNLSGPKAVYIDGQTQRSPTRETATVVLERDNETYELLTALTHHNFNNKTWDFDEAAFYQLKCIVWLEKHRSELIKNVAGNTGMSQQQLLVTALNMEFIRFGIAGGFERNDADLRRNMFSLVEKKERPHTGVLWKKLASQYRTESSLVAFRENKAALTRTINFIMGNSKDAATSKYLVDRLLVDGAFTEISKLHWDITEGSIPTFYIKNKKQQAALIWLKEQIPNVKQVLAEEVERFHTLLEEIKEYIEDPATEQGWSEAASEIKTYLVACNDEYSITYTDEMKQTQQWFAGKNTITAMTSIVRHGIEIAQSGNFAQQMIFFSSDPCGSYLERALLHIKSVCSFAEKQQSSAENAMAKLRSEISGDTEEMLIKATQELEDLYQYLEGVSND